MLDSAPRQDTLAFQVDLWSARGELPRDMAEVETRQKEIRYSSRTRANTDQFKQHADAARARSPSCCRRLPEALRETPEDAAAEPEADHKVYNIIQLIYRAQSYEGASKDYEFSRRTMEEHWRAGYHDAVRTLRHPEVLQRPASPDGVFTFDLAARRTRVAQSPPMNDHERESAQARLRDAARPARPTRRARTGSYNREYLIITYRTDPDELRDDRARAARGRSRDHW